MRQFVLMSIIVVLAGTCLQAVGQTAYECDFTTKGMDRFTLNPYEESKGGWLEKGDKLSGTASLAARGENNYYQYFARVNPIILCTDQEYKISVSAKKTGSGLCSIHVFFMKDGKMPSPPLSIGLKIENSDEWTKRERTFELPEGFNSVELRFRLCNADAGTVGYFDNLKIEKVVKKVEEGAAEPAPEPTGENYIYQCDFDENMDNRIDIGRKQGASLSKVSQVSGEYSLYAGGTGDYYQIIAFVKDMPFKPGRTYKLSIWSKGKGQPTCIISAFFYKDGKMPSPPISTGLHLTPSEEWKKYEKSFTVPAEFEGGHIYFRLPSAPASTEIFLDDFVVTLVPVGLKVGLECSASEEELSFDFNLADFLGDHELKDIKLDVNFMDKDSGESLLSRTVDGFSTAQTRETISFRSLPKKTYSIEFKVYDSKGELLDTKSKPFTIFRDPEWLGNQLGILPASAPPPSPWTPMKESNGQVAMWGRTYQIGDNGLPSEIDTLGQSILLEPVSLHGLEGKLPKVALKEEGPQKVVYQGRKDNEAYSTEVTTEIEYDGMLKYTLRIVPKKDAVTIKDLYLDVAMDSDIATLLSRSYTGESWWKGAAGVDLQKEKECSFNEFNPHIWISNGEKGLAWFAESCKDWNVTQKPYLSIRTQAGKTTLRVQFVDSAIKIGEPYELVFGLQATPTRPRRADWKEMRFRTKTIPTNMDVMWSNKAYYKYHGTPAVADDPSGFKKVQDMIEYCLWLIYPHNTHDELPEYVYFRERWEHPGTTYQIEPCGFTGHLVPVDSRDQIWCDLLCHKVHEWVKKWDVKGMYHDGFGPQTKDGHTNIFAFRELAKRLYIIHRQLVPDALTVVFSQRFAPCSSFSDAILTGEGYRVELAEQEYYTAFLTLRDFRNDNAMWLGPECMILPQYKIGYKKSVKHAVHAMGMFFLHDLMVYAAWLNMDVYDDLQTRRIQFGWDQAQFHGYWQDAGRVSADKEEIVLSYYEKADSLFITVFNNSKEKVSAEIEITTRGLKLSSPVKITSYDAVTRTEEEPANKGSTSKLKVPLEIEGYMMKVLVVK